MPAKDVHLSDVQFAVMKVLWDSDRATTAEVHATAGKPRDLAYTTISTVLTRLEKRGLVKSAKDQNERVFQALVTEGEVAKSMVSSLVDTLFRGDPQALVSHLVKEKEIDKGDLETLRKLLSKEAKK